MCRMCLCRSSSRCLQQSRGGRKGPMMLLLGLTRGRLGDDILGLGLGLGRGLRLARLENVVA